MKNALRLFVIGPLSGDHSTWSASEEINLILAESAEQATANDEFNRRAFEVDMTIPGLLLFQPQIDIS